MLTELQLENFKSFEKSTVHFGLFSLLVGANASGKSNVREALRFLHGVARGYTLAETLGEKWAEGGVKAWTGLRGGALQAARHGSDQFRLTARFTTFEPSPRKGTSPRRRRYEYHVGVSVENGDATIVAERLHVDGDYVFDTHPEGRSRGSAEGVSIKARARKHGRGAPPDGVFVTDRPILGQFLGNSAANESTRRSVRTALASLQSMTFLDLDPDSARRSSPRGLTRLGDRGENLPSVLAAICEMPERRAILTSWIRALTPMDAVDIQFQHDLDNRTMAVLIESDGQATPLSSASDGTVRFLAMIASLLNPDRPQTTFFEEIENGIHPHRIALLLDLIEQSVDGDHQVIATSHSPQLLVHALRSPNSLPSLVARTEEHGSIAIDVRHNPAFAEVLAAHDPAELMAAGWMEDTAAFETAPEAAS